MTDNMRSKVKLRNYSLYDFMSLMLISYVTVSSVYPPLEVAFIDNSILNILFISIWILISFFRNPGFFYYQSFHRFLTFVFIVISSMLPYLFGYATIGNRYIGIAPIFLLYIIYDYNNKCGKQYLNILVVKITIFFSLITLFITGRALLINPYISRSLTSVDNARILMRQGIGGYSFIYFITILSPILGYISLKSNIVKKSFSKTVLLIMCVAMMTVIILSNYFTAFLVVVGASILLVVLTFFRKQRAIFLLFLISGLIIFIFMGKHIVLFSLDFISDFVGNGLTYYRIKSMEQAIIQTNSLGIDTTRFELIRTSINAFMKNPLFGIIASGNNDILSFSHGFGQHSHIIDTFALLGLLPGLLQIYLIVKPYVNRSKLKKYGALNITILLSVLFILFFNIATVSIGVVSSFILPTILSCITTDYGQRRKIIS